MQSREELVVECTTFSAFRFEYFQRGVGFDVIVRLKSGSNFIKGPGMHNKAELARFRLRDMTSEVDLQLGRAGDGDEDGDGETCRGSGARQTQSWMGVIIAECWNTCVHWEGGSELVFVPRLSCW